MIRSRIAASKVVPHAATLASPAAQ